MRFVPLLILAACAAPRSDLDVLADAVQRSAWDDVERVRFTWHHLGKDLKRSYDWNRAGGFRAEGAPHQAFVNDSYWFLFEYLIFGDGSRKSDLGRLPVPGFPDLGDRPAIDVRYAKDEGYTGGDRYVLYLGDDGLPVAWAFHKGGAETPTLVTTRGKRRTVAGLSVPTEFAKPDGTVVIRVTDIEIDR